MKIVKAQKKFEQLLKIWAKNFKPFMDRVVVESLKLFKNLQTLMMIWKNR